MKWDKRRESDSKTTEDLKYFAARQLIPDRTRFPMLTKNIAGSLTNECDKEAGFARHTGLRGLGDRVLRALRRRSHSTREHATKLCQFRYRLLRYLPEQRHSGADSHHGWILRRVTLGSRFRLASSGQRWPILLPAQRRQQTLSNESMRKDLRKLTSPARAKERRSRPTPGH